MSVVKVIMILILHIMVTGEQHLVIGEEMALMLTDKLGIHIEQVQYLQMPFLQNLQVVL